MSFGTEKSVLFMEVSSITFHGCPYRGAPLYHSCEVTVQCPKIMRDCTISLPLITCKHCSYTITTLLYTLDN